MVVGQGVKYLLAGAAGLDKAGDLEGGQLVGDGRGAHAQGVGQVADAQLPLIQRPYNAQTGLVAQRLEKDGGL